MFNKDGLWAQCSYGLNEVSEGVGLREHGLINGVLASPPIINQREPESVVDHVELHLVLKVESANN